MKRLIAILVVAPLLAQPVVPGKEWAKWQKPEAAGYSAKKLEAVRGWLGTLGTTAMMVVVGGRQVFEYGDLAHLSYLASVRKSILAMLYGKYVANGTIDLNKTLKEIGLNDKQGLTERELEAKVEHLIAARSGVYHPASNAGDNTDSAPPRGSQRAGSYYLYNNWDFNAAGGVFEKLTGVDIHDALDNDLAQPVGMQDFDRGKQQKSGDPERSQHKAYHMWLSTRDMARLGLLMQREGDWGGAQVVETACVGVGGRGGGNAGDCVSAWPANAECAGDSGGRRAVQRADSGCGAWAASGAVAIHPGGTGEFGGNPGRSPYGTRPGGGAAGEQSNLPGDGNAIGPAAAGGDLGRPGAFSAGSGAGAGIERPAIDKRAANADRAAPLAVSYPGTGIAVSREDTS